MAMERARQQVAELLNCEPETLLFTSGGTESNNLALFGGAQRYSTPQHLIISSGARKGGRRKLLKLPE